MTDKEIVVGGIDVSGCKCLRNVKIILELARPEDFELLCGATNGAMKCEQWKDCYYKQLQRKTKECEKISSLLRNTDIYSKVCNTCKDDILIYPSISSKTNYTDNEVEVITLTKIINKLKRKTAECEKLNEDYTLMKQLRDSALKDYNKEFEYKRQITVEHLEQKKELLKQLKRKEQECDELRKENKKLIWKCLERKCKIINLINENSTKEVIYRINGKCVKTTANRVKEITAIVNNQLKKYEQQDRYKQAIDEISELANENKNTPQYRGICQSILEIINNAKDINVPSKKDGNNE